MRHAAAAEDAAQLVPGVLVVDIGIAQRLLKMPDQVSRLLIGKAKGSRAPLEAVAGDKLRLVEPDAESDLERLTDSFHLNLTAFGLLSFLVGLFIVNSAIGLAFEQRLPMLRTLRACGVSSRTLNAVLLIELVSLALVAGLVGLVCGYFIAASLLPDVAASLRGLYGAQIPGQLTLKPEWWVAGLAISVLGALAAAATSLIKAIRLPVLAAAQPYAWQQAQHRWLLLQGALALVVFAAAAAFLWFGDSLIVGICGAGGAAARRGARPARGAGFCALSRPAQHAPSARDMVLGRQPAATVGIVAGVDGAAAGAGGQCRRRHHGARVSAGRSPAGSTADWRPKSISMPPSDAQAAEIKAWLRQRPEVEAILPGGRADVQIDGWPVEILGFADHATYRDRWPLLESTADVWDRVRSGEGALISEQLARRMKLRLGDRLQVPTPAETGRSKSSAFMRTTAIQKARSASTSMR